MSGEVHVIGAGLAGLAAAAALARDGANVTVHEAAQQAGGRCRSYFEPALGLTIDNGNHLVLAGNRQAMAYARLIGAADRLTGPDSAEFDFHDLRTGEGWRLRLNDGPLAWWIFSPARRAPGTRALDYFALARLLWAGRGATIGASMACEGPLYERLWHPLLVAALNTDPREASAALAANVVKQSLARGGLACSPRIAAKGLSHALVDPAVEFLRARGGEVRFGRRLRALAFADGHVERLDFGAESVRLSGQDAVILAVPPWAAAELVPDLSVAHEARAIVNGHFKFDPPESAPKILGLIGGAAEWLFCYEGRISTTTSAAEALVDMPREDLAARLWRDVAQALNLPAVLPPWQVVKEKRATFAATPAQDALRPKAATRWRNLFLAGDHIQTGLPATIEGAVGSGFAAARLARRAMRP